ncbi:oxidoreductase [Rhizodiscina lignyota]|uniref:Oxidoreductase n=1 Tax=Rhizodiscina lignyota TaxID=1504668 RepID=A0A9P4I152_9PEZI|nr:oxidoreductase [Rhizodiscina lignyota]
MPSNKAAYLEKVHVSPFQVRDAPYTSPGPKEIVIRNRAVAINPIDWILQDKGDLTFTWIKHPFVLGSDTAGEVVEVGSGITRFQVGDRVCGLALATDKHYNRSAEGAFQLYTILQDNMASPVPATMSYEEASVIPLGLSTAACALFQRDVLGLQHPKVPTPQPTGKTLLVWGGSTSVGCNAIQLAVAAGYDVITTSSPRNFELVKKLGATEAFDYNSPTVVNDIVKAFEGRTSAGALALGKGSADACIDILSRCKGDKFVAMATFPLPDPEPTRLVLLQTIIYFVSANIRLSIKSALKGIKTKFINGSDLAQNEVGKAMFEDFLPHALANNSYICAPEPQVFGSGLEMLQAACDLQKKGVSAKKIVVTL